MGDAGVTRALVLAGALLVAAVVPARAVRRAVCPDGRFVQAGPVLPGATRAPDAVVLRDGRIAIESGCAPARARSKALRSGDTRVRARWRRCGTLRAVRLNATIIADSEPCRRLVGTIAARGTAGGPVAAIRSACGDRIVDAGRGETCDPPGEGCSTSCTNDAGGGSPDVPARTWTWVPAPDTRCANGEPSGFGVNPGDPHGRLLVFLMGGGACWDETTCYVLGTASNFTTGYDAAQFAGDAAGLLTTSLWDRNDGRNPFRDDNFVFVPYCTGDVHAGSRPDAAYGTRVAQHVGFRNMTAILQRLVPAFPGVSRVVLSGSSAGGFGALANWWQTQQAFGAIRVDLLDDSGPTLPAPYLTEGLEQTWRYAWNLAAATPPGCTGCAGDLDALIAFYATQLPGHRAALLSYTQDGVIGLFYQLSGPQVASGLDALAASMARYDVWRHFFVAGSAHTMLGHPAGTVQNGVTLLEFVTRMVTDDPGWASVAP